jgi:hypothetical protein
MVKAVDILIEDLVSVVEAEKEKAGAAGQG